MNREGMSCRMKSTDIFHALYKRSKENKIIIIDPQEEYQATQCLLKEKAVKMSSGVHPTGKDE